MTSSMSLSDRLTLAGALAVVLAAAALVPVYDGLGWVLPVVGAVAAVAGAAALARRSGLGRLLHPVVALLGLAAYVCLVFARSTLAFLVLPTGETITVLGDLVRQGLLDVEELAPPVPSRPGLVLLAVLGIGAIGVVVDLLAVSLRAAAVAGLPLLLLFAVPAAVLPDGLGWWPFALGAAGWLGLLLTDGSDTVSRWGTPLRAGRAATDPGLGRVGRRIGAAALGVAVVVPAVLPGLDGRLLGGDGSGSGFGGGSRSTTTYNPILELGGKLRLPEPGRLLMRYETDDPRPDYLRLTTLDRFDEETGWSSSELSADLQDDAVQPGVPVPLDATRVDVLPITTTIDVGQLEGPWLPTPVVPTSIDVDGPWLWDEESQTVFSTRTSLGELDGTYTVSASRIAPTVELLRSAGRPPREIADAFGVAPVVSPYVAQLIDETVTGAETDYDKVAAIQDLFRDRSNGFRYDEDAAIPGFNAPDALENFLRGRRGFCEQYASAMAAMVRTLGIPARVAVGFTPGDQRRDDVYEVTTSDAHAWPEIWFAGAGWVRFEPTPRSDQTTTPSYTVPPVEAPVTDAPTTAPAAPGAAASAGPNPGAVDRGDDLGDLAAGEADAWLSRGATIALGVVAGLTAVAVLPMLLAGWRRRRRWSSPGPLAAWEQVRDDALDAGHTWRPADSPRAAAAQLAADRSLHGPVREALDRVALGAERARYARSAPDVGASALAADVRTVREGVLRDVGRGRRFAARWAPASTLHWAREELSSRTADALDRFDLLVAAVGDRVKHPRATFRRRAAG
ncbi:DUF3488 and transglutaminase-like domain-containing protein [soil metagenome]